jgi:hypothetical protein
MVNRIIKLNPLFSFELVKEDNDWTRIYLNHKNSRIEMGAEKLSIIAERFLSAFSDFSNKKLVGNWDGINAISVISLYEKHYTIYLGKTMDINILFIEDAEGNLIYKINLDTCVVELLQSTSLVNIPVL